VANSGAMALFATLVNDSQLSLKLRQDLHQAQTLLHARATLFLHEAKLTNLPLYPFSEGFFIMIHLPDQHQQLALHQALMKEHIYTVATAGGLRLALCSIETKQIKGLANRIATIYESSKLTF
jgi:aspartate aminotransferase/aromatic-amino-acid transaminase